MSQIFELTNRSVIKVSGPDRLSFLQGLITNDINKATAESFVYAFMLMPQGRFLYDFFITSSEDFLLIDCPAKDCDEIMRKLTMYKLRADVEISTTDLRVFACFDKLEGFLPDPRNSEIGFRSLQSVVDGADPNISEYEKRRIALLIPDAEQDFIKEKSFPLEYGGNQLNAIDYTKGCYIGQEVTARTHNRGVVRKRLYHIRFSENTVEKESEIFADESKIGIVLGSSELDALALIRHEQYESALESNASFHVEQTKIQVI